MKKREDINDNHKIAIEFLLWSYFKLAANSSKEKIIEKCVSRAYSDATNQGAYNTIKKEGVKYNPKLILGCINNPISDYDSWHKASCQSIVENFGDSAFTYGNAQKWLNMTIKYLFIVNSVMEMLGAAEDFRDFYRRKFKDFEGDFHVPIDSYIIESLWDEKATVEETSEWLSLKEEKTRKDGTLGAYYADKHKVWSQFDAGDYQKVKKHIADKVSKEGVSPMKWENEKWIGVAKKEKRKKDEA